MRFVQQSKVRERRYAVETRGVPMVAAVAGARLGRVGSVGRRAMAVRPAARYRFLDTRGTAYRVHALLKMTVNFNGRVSLKTTQPTRARISAPSFHDDEDSHAGEPRRFY